MSLLDVGASCSSCGLVDFLPFTCQNCQHIFCTSHIQTHQCDAAISSVETTSHAGPSSTTSPKAKCSLPGCDNPTLESVMGVEDGSGEGIAKEIRCAGCGSAFCVTHRSQTSHSCSAPPDHTERHEAFLKRRAKAKALLSKTFPDQVNKTIPKPPPPRDVIRTKPISLSPKKLPPSLTNSTQISGNKVSTSNTSSLGGSKSKTQKIHDMHIRKLRSLARPLIPGSSGIERERRFFEWAIDESTENVRKWIESGVWHGGQVERVWVKSEIPCGKILDQLVKLSKMARPKDLNDPNQPQLINLFSPLDAARQVVPINLANPASTIHEGSTIILIKGDQNFSARQ